MQRIDQETVRKILDTADIVEVVSDFVTLKRSGHNYIGLCPFHNERTPSFSVSPAKGYCKCFSCGKGGSAVGFIMEHESLSYGEALRWLAKKYNIEIKERELTAEELAAASERESMLALNDFALDFFEHTLTDTDEGRNVGLAYFRRRGLTDAAIKRFRLGFAPEQRDALARAAMAKGYSRELLRDVGLCSISDRGGIYDRFRGRVIYPVFALSGKVVAFGGRTLSTSKEVAKYVNSPESTIYHKSNQLYGLYQARRAIVQADKCILVEGYMDVISMSQRGVENVVASSGTSLTEGQIALIHRFTRNVTVIYDSDAAGIKASLRGIDLLLAQGLNVKVLLLPEGDDPDSFAQAHSREEIQAYMDEHETDFIRFKTQILLRDVKENDPVARAGVIANIAKSISVIGDPLIRSEYVKECSRLLQSKEEIVALQVAKYRNENLDKLQRTPRQESDQSDWSDRSEQRTDVGRKHDLASYLRPAEKEIVRLVVRYGMLHLADSTDEEGNTVPVNVMDYVNYELTTDEISLSNPDLAAVYSAALGLSATCEAETRRIEAEAEQLRRKIMDEGHERIRREATNLTTAEQMERELAEEADLQVRAHTAEAAERFVMLQLGSSPDDTVRRLSTSLATEKYTLSKIHTKNSRVEAERDLLPDRVPKAVHGLKIAILRWRETQLRQQLAAQGADVEAIMMQLVELKQTVSELAKYLGERIVLPK